MEPGGCKNFLDHMVLKHDVHIPTRGWEIHDGKVQLQFNGTEYRTIVDSR